MQAHQGDTIIPANVQVSVLKDGTKTLNAGKVVVSSVSTLGEVVQKIRNSPELRKRTEALRHTLAEGGRTGDYAEAKLWMPAIIPAALAPAGTLIEKLPPAIYANGLYGFDIDESRHSLDLPVLRTALIESPGIVMVGTSCAGDALYAVYAGLLAQSEFEYKEHWRAIASQMPAGAKAASGKQSKNFNRLRFLAHDPNVWLAETVTPLPGALSPTSGTSPPSSPAPQLTAEEGIDRQALDWIEPPEEYNAWLGWLATLKVLGFSVEDVEAWSARGSKYQRGEVAKRWEGLPDDNLEDARRKLRGHTRNNGWRKIALHTGDDGSPRGTNGGPIFPVPAGQPEWYEFAQWYSEKHLKGRFIYDSRAGQLAWWYFDGKVWKPLTKDDMRLLDGIGKNRYLLAQELYNQGMERIANVIARKSEWTAARADKSDLWGGLRYELAGAAPQPQTHHLGTPLGVVDLRDGRMHPHDPKYGIRGLTGGKYRPESEPEHLVALNERFGKVFAPHTLDAYLRLIALALTGRAQSYRSVVLVIGPSGSGKGDACNVALSALGERGMGVAADWLQVNLRSEIDVTGAEMLERQPAIVKVDEVGGDTRISVSRLLSLTGNAPTSARRPHGPLISGTHGFQLWTTAVDAPQMPRHRGIERRLAVLPTLRRFTTSEIDEEGAYAPALLDAVLTLAIQYAREVYQDGYEPPEGDSQAKRDTLADMDVLAEWLEDSDNLDGMPVAEARQLAIQALDMSEQELSPTAFGRKVSSSSKWMKAKLSGGKRVILRRPTCEEMLM